MDLDRFDRPRKPPPPAPPRQQPPPPPREPAGDDPEAPLETELVGPPEGEARLLAPPAPLPFWSDPDRRHLVVAGAFGLVVLVGLAFVWNANRERDFRAFRTGKDRWYRARVLDVLGNDARGVYLRLGSTEDRSSCRVVLPWRVIDRSPEITAGRMSVFGKVGEEMPYPGEINPDETLYPWLFHGRRPAIVSVHLTGSVLRGVMNTVTRGSDPVLVAHELKPIR